MKALEHIFLPKPAGLYNTGSICYFNSLLQVLASCTSLHHWHSKSNSEIENAFEDFINNSKEFNPNASNRLLTFLTKAMPGFGHGQESASEALVLLINAIDSNSLNNIFLHRFRYNIKCLSCFHTTNQNVDTSIIFEIFHTSKLSENDILHQKSIVADYKCEKCNNIGAVKSSKLTMLSEIIICLFNVYHNKTVHIFPKYLNFPGKDKLLKYMIIGQVEHSGSLNGGHYWARALRKDGIYLFNDNSYSKSNIEPTANTYIVLYHLID